MPRRRLVLIAAAVIIGLITFAAVRSSMNSGQVATTSAAPEPASQVLGAARDLPVGTILKDTDIKWIAWPAEAQGPSLFVKGTADKAALVGSVVRHSMRAEDPLMRSQVVDPHAQGFLAAVLKPGMRAMSISVNPGGEVAGFIFPGDRVDVILGHAVNRKDDPDLTDRHMSVTVLQDVRVLALDQKHEDQNNEPKIAQLATLEVTPRQAERLVLSGQLGTLSLSLRSLAVEDTLVTPPSPDQIPASDSIMASHTWDSDISQAFPVPGGDDGLLQKVQVMRGKETSESTFERRR